MSTTTATSPLLASLDAETIQAAEILSGMAYDSLTTITEDPNYAALILEGWTMVSNADVGEPSDNNNYQGVAFYKVGANGDVQVIIANRGTTGIADVPSDIDIALGVTPPADTDAYTYYQSVVAWVQAHVGQNVTALETGHSLGGQEADYVVAEAAKDNYSVQPLGAVTFDAPGIAADLNTQAPNQDALNISNAAEIVHTVGAYDGVSVTVGADSASGSVYATEGAAAGVSALGVLGALLGAGICLAESIDYNHALSRITNYLQDNPELGAVNVQTTAPDLINQADINALTSLSQKLTPSQYYAMTPAQQASLIASVLAQNGAGITSAAPTTSGNINETFTASGTSSDELLTGSLGDDISIQTSGSQITISESNQNTGNDPNTEILTLNSAGTQITSEQFSVGDPTTGTVTFAADGSSTCTTTYANGDYATTLDDGQGNITTDYYTKDHVEIRATWVHSDGSSGTEELYADGQTVTPNSSSADSVPTTESSVLQNPDGSYSTVSSNPQDSGTTVSYNASGSVTSQSTATGSGVDDQVVTNSISQYGNNVELTDKYNAAGALIGTSWYSANPDGSANPAGVYVAWAKATATSGGETDHASGVILRTATALDGTQYVDTQELQGDTVTHLSSAGVLLSDSWSLIDGSNSAAASSVTGSDTFNTDGSATGSFSDVRDGTAGTVTVTSAGDITVVNTNASGVVTSEDTYNAGTGNYTIATLNANGTTRNAYEYLPDGNVQVTDYAPDGVTVADQETVASGLVINPDGSSFSKMSNADGSYTVYYQNASGDTTAWQYTSGGKLTGSYHTTNYNWPNSGWSGSLSNGQSWTGTLNSYTPTYTDAQGNAWTLYLDAAGQETGADWFNATAGTHGYETFNADGSQYDVSYNADGSSDTISSDGKGDITEEYFDASGSETGDAWKAADGSHGGDTYNADGSSSGTSVNADGSYGAYTDDGQGNVTSAEYSATGTLLSDTWTKSDGTSGSDVYNSDGSSLSTAYAADGSYTVTNNDGKGDLTQTDYASSGVETGDAWQKADGSYGSDTYNTDGSSSGDTVNADHSYSTYANDGQGNDRTQYYSASGVYLGDAWASSNGGSGSDTFFANGSEIELTTNADGSSSVTTLDGQGNDLTTNYSSAGVAVSDSWTNANGAQGSDTFNADGSSSGVSANVDGTSSTYTKDASGNEIINFYNAGGTLTEVEALGADGQKTITNESTGAVEVFNLDGTYSVTAQAGDGTTTTNNYSANGALVSDSWTQADGTSGTDAFNAGGSSSGSVSYSDGSSSTYTNDGQGDILTQNFDTTGVLVSDTWQQQNGTHGSDAYSADGSSQGSTYYTNGDYSDYATDTAGDATTKNYAPDGELLSTMVQSANGSTTTTTTTAGQFESADFAVDGTYSKTSVDANGQATITFYNAQNQAIGSTTYSIPTLTELQSGSGYGGSIPVSYTYSLTADFADGTVVSAQTALGAQTGESYPTFYTEESVTQLNGVVLTHGATTQTFNTNPNQPAYDPQYPGYEYSGDGGYELMAPGNAAIPYSGNILSNEYYSTSGVLLGGYTYNPEDPSADPSFSSYTTRQVSLVDLGAVPNGNGVISLGPAAASNPKDGVRNCLIAGATT